MKKAWGTCRPISMGLIVTLLESQNYRGTISEETNTWTNCGLKLSKFKEKKIIYRWKNLREFQTNSETAIPRYNKTIEKQSSS